MRPEGDDGPDQPGDSDAPDSKSGDEPSYTVYGKGGEGRKQKAPEDAEDAPKRGGGSDKPDYKVYRSRPSLRDRFRKPDLGGIRRAGAGGGGLRDRLHLGGGGGRR
jgi:hypothetical protein